MVLFFAWQNGYGRIDLTRKTVKNDKTINESAADAIRNATRHACTRTHSRTRCNAPRMRVAAQIDTVVTKANGWIASRLREITSTFSGTERLQGRGYSRPDPVDARDPVGRSARGAVAPRAHWGQEGGMHLAKQENYRFISRAYARGSISFYGMHIATSLCVPIEPL